MKNIVLIGIMGCGKTTLSRMLGEKLNRPVIDIDEYIVENIIKQFQRCLKLVKHILGIMKLLDVKMFPT